MQHLFYDIMSVTYGHKGMKKGRNGLHPSLCATLHPSLAKSEKVSASELSLCESQNFPLQCDLYNFGIIYWELGNALGWVPLGFYGSAGIHIFPLPTTIARLHLTHLMMHFLRRRAAEKSLRLKVSFWKYSSPTGLLPEVPMLQAFENEVGRGWTRLIIAVLTIISLCFSLLELSLPLHRMVSWNSYQDFHFQWIEILDF